MQPLICSLIILIAALYVINRWMPLQLKQRLLQLFGKTPLPQNSNESAGACGSCSSCSGCGSTKTKATDSAKLTKM